MDAENQTQTRDAADIRPYDIPSVEWELVAGSEFENGDMVPGHNGEIIVLGGRWRPHGEGRSIFGGVELKTDAPEDHLCCPRLGDSNSVGVSRGRHIKLVVRQHALGKNLKKRANFHEVDGTTFNDFLTDHITTVDLDHEKEYWMLVPENGGDE